MNAYQPDRLHETGKKARIVTAIARENPVLTGGAALSLFVMGAIFTNAIWFQSGKHPAPLFSTRVEQKPVEKVVRTASVKPVPKPTLKPEKADETSQELLREIQTALSVRGYYSGKLDGVYGSQTRQAVNSFQNDNDLTVDGKATVRLLTHILMSATSRPAEVPLPKSIETKTPTVEVKTVKLKRPESETVTQGVVARIQSGLKAYGYDDLIVDGKMGQNTATAIQRFQLDYGMKITGQPSDKVLQKLQEIGAVNG